MPVVKHQWMPGMHGQFKPMLAGTPTSDDAIRFPVLASPKIDGVRAMVSQNKLYSRSLKLIPNHHVQKSLGIKDFHGFDGELTVGDPTDRNVMQNTTSGVMSLDKVPAFTYHVFDYWESSAGFEERYQHVAELVRGVQENWANIAIANRIDGAGAVVAACPIVLVEQQIIHTLDELALYESEMLEEGWEGVMLRSLDGKYKWGRSTSKEGGLLKVKRFSDSEAVVIGFEEEMFNGNEATTSELGRTKRSSAKAGKTGKGTLGAFIVKDVQTGVQFNIGSGIATYLGDQVWQDQPKYLNKIVKYKYFPHGVKEAPRHPVFIGFRDPRDM